MTQVRLNDRSVELIIAHSDEDESVAAAANRLFDELLGLDDDPDDDESIPIENLTITSADGSELALGDVPRETRPPSRPPRRAGIRPRARSYR